MSLFKIRDWWNIECGSGEEFDHNSLCVANIDNHPNGADKLIVGSHSGILRIFSVNMHANEDGKLIGSQPSDLLLEIDLKSPILQVSAGLFLSATDKIHLAVLRSKKLSIYSVSATAGVTDHGLAYNILLIYEHNLKRNAHSLIVGPFGQVKGRDFLCVQSLDGNLTFYEQESLAFSRFLPNILLPGPLEYNCFSDSFIVATSNWAIESYRYQVLAIAKQSNNINEMHGQENASESNVKARKVTPDWNLSIGEGVVDIKVLVLDKSACYIIVLGERNMFVLKENGTIWFMKRLDFNPSCLCVFSNDANDSLFALVATHMFTLLIYCNDMLKWATQLPFTPVVIQRANLNNIQGLVVLLSSQGLLCCSYLGTNPSLKIVPVSETSINHIKNYSDTEKELNELRKIISSANLDNSAVGNNNSNNLGSGIGLGMNASKVPQSDLILNVCDLEVFSNMIPNNNYHKGGDKTASSSLTPAVKLVLQFVTTNTLTNLKLTVDLPKSLIAEPNVLSIPNIGNDPEPPCVDLMIYRQNSISGFPSTRINLIAAYTNEHGAPRVEVKSIYLPLSVFSKLATPNKESPQHVMIFDTLIDGSKQSSMSLNELFVDLYETNSNQASNNNINSTIGIEILSEHSLVSIHTSMQGQMQKYRINSDSFGSLAFISNELIRRLNRNNVKFDTTKFDKKMIPLKETFAIIEDHLKGRVKVRQLQGLLADKAAHFRVVQKRLLIKLKDRNPTPMNNLDLLLKLTHSQMLSIGDDLLKEINQLDKLSSHLSSSINLICSLLLMSKEFELNSQKIIKSIFTHHISCDIEEGWEERTEMALSTLLNTSREISGNMRLAGSDLTIPETNENLNKCIQLLIDRLLQGESLSQRESMSQKSFVQKNEAILEEEEDDHVDDHGKHKNRRASRNSIESNQLMY